MTLRNLETLLAWHACAHKKHAQARQHARKYRAEHGEITPAMAEELRELYADWKALDQRVNDTLDRELKS